MQLVARRLEGELGRRARRQVGHQLVRCARRGAGDRAGEAVVDRAVQMAAQDALDLRMARDDRREIRRVLERMAVHMLDAGRERRVVHHDQRRLGRRISQRSVEPIELLGAQEAAVVAGNMRVERDEAHRIALDRVLQNTFRRQVSVGGERGTQPVT